MGAAPPSLPLKPVLPPIKTQLWDLRGHISYPAVLTLPTLVATQEIDLGTVTYLRRDSFAICP